MPLKPYEANTSKLTQYAPKFREKVQATLRKIQTVYPGLQVEVTDAALIVKPSKTAISKQLP